MSSFELNIDVFDPESVENALYRLYGYMDWLDGYSDNVAHQVSNLVKDTAKNYAHVDSGEMRESIRSEYVMDGVYEVVADPADPSTGEHYALFELEGGNTGSPACDEQSEHTGGPDFAANSIKEVVGSGAIQVLAEACYTW